MSGSMTESAGHTPALVRMANDIARNLAAAGEEAAVAETARHIRAYWAPQMIAAIPSLNRAGLSPLAAAALDRVMASAGQGGS